MIIITHRFTGLLNFNHIHLVLEKPVCRTFISERHMGVMTKKNYKGMDDSNKTNQLYIIL